MDGDHTAVTNWWSCTWWGDFGGLSLAPCNPAETSLAFFLQHKEVKVRQHVSFGVVAWKQGIPYALGAVFGVCQHACKWAATVVLRWRTNSTPHAIQSRPTQKYTDGCALRQHSTTCFAWWVRLSVILSACDCLDLDICA